MISIPFIAMAVMLFIGLFALVSKRNLIKIIMPAPQALTLTSIVINISVVALMLSFAIMIYQHTGSLDARKRRLKG